MPTALPFLTLAALLALTVLTSCVSREPVQRSTIASQDPGAVKLRRELQELFDIWTEAFRTGDGALIYRTLSQDLAQVCNTNTLQEWIEWNTAPGRDNRDIKVISGFKDAGNPDRAIAEVRIGERPSGSTESQPLGASTAQSDILPYQLLKEQGRWRLHDPFFPLRSGSCPFEVPMYGTGGRDQGYDYPEIPGLDFSELDTRFPRTETVGDLSSLSSRSMTSSRSSSGHTYTITLSGYLITPLASSELMDLYRKNLAHPSWDIRDEGKGDEGAWLTWTVRDGQGTLVFGSLTIVKVGIDQQEATLSLRTSP